MKQGPYIGIHTWTAPPPIFVGQLRLSRPAREIFGPAEVGVSGQWYWFFRTRQGRQYFTIAPAYPTRDELGRMIEAHDTVMNLYAFDRGEGEVFVDYLLEVGVATEYLPSEELQRRGRGMTSGRRRKTRTRSKR